MFRNIFCFPRFKGAIETSTEEDVRRSFNFRLKGDGQKGFISYVFLVSSHYSYALLSLLIYFTSHEV